MSRRVTLVPRVVLFLVLVASLGVTTAPQPPYVMASGASPADLTPQLRTVRFGSPGAISDAGVFIGRERGYFREQGLDVDFVPFQSGPDTMVPMAAGDLEVGSGNFGIVWLNAVERGVGIQAVADKGHSSPGFEFVQVPLRRDLADSGQVQTPADLRGRRIGMSVLRSGGEVVVADILRRGGMGVDDVDLVALGYPEMLAGLTNRALDAAVLIEPTLSAAVARGIVAPWEAGRASTVFGGAYQASLIFYAGQFAAQSDLAQRWMVAYLRGIRAYNDAFIRGEGRAEAVRLLTETTAIKDPAVYDQMQMAGLDPDGRINQESLRIELEYYRNRGYYTGPVTLDRVIDPSFAETAARQLGPYR
jgi:NitT/TauT family transport system substrate-binding protein